MMAWARDPKDWAELIEQIGAIGLALPGSVAKKAIETARKQEEDPAADQKESKESDVD